jgi:hypothetical protein
MKLNIPKSIINRLQLDRFDLIIKLLGPAAIYIDDELVYTSDYDDILDVTHSHKLKMNGDKVVLRMDCASVYELTINDVDMITCGLAYRFVDGPEFHNGKFTMELPIPILPGFIKLVSPIETHGLWPNPNLKDSILQNIELLRNRSQNNRAN